MPSIWTATELVQLELQLAGRQSLLEFGCGEATLVAARQARQIVAVDGDRERLAAIARRAGGSAAVRPREELRDSTASRDKHWRAGIRG